MPDYIKVAKKYLKQGYSVIPVTANKVPSIPTWTKFQTQVMTEQEAERYFKSAEGIAVLCGGTSRLVCLDADMKYDLTGDLWDRFKKAIPKDISKKLFCQKTKNKGFHLVFIAPSTRLFGNEKFASRHTTAEERHITYMEAFRNPKTREMALNIATQDKSRVLFESRSGRPDAAGGYFLTSPSPGYEFVYGKYNELTEEEYDILIDTARSFNEFISEDKYNKDIDASTQWELSPFDHFNKEGDVVSLLEKFGWALIVSGKGKNYRFKRPGHTHTKDSAILDFNTKVFNVFTTSTSFDVGRGYTPSGVFIHLECEGDDLLGYKKLVQLGYGIKKVE